MHDELVDVDFILEIMIRKHWLKKTSFISDMKKETAIENELVGTIK
jgi:hypothetical protein